jgi:hypothetical protein
MVPIVAMAATLFLITAAPDAVAAPCRDCGGGGTGGGTSIPVLRQMAAYQVALSNFGRTVCQRTSSGQILCGYTPDTLPSNDDINVTESAGSSGLITIVLTTSGNITWYKEIKAFDVSGNTLGWVSTSDTAHGPVSMTLPAANVAALVFTKAGFLGIHVAQYDLRGIAGRAGFTETFQWTKD